MIDNDTSMVPAGAAPPPDSAPYLLEIRVAESAEVVAMIDGDTTVTYRELGERAERLAAALASWGIGAGDLVVTKLHTRWEWFVIHLALSKLEAWHVSASWGLTDQELAHVLKDSAARVFIHDDDEPRLPEGLSGDIRELPLDARGRAVPDLRQMMATPTTERRIAPHPATLVIFTAGTSGQPKGAIVSFRRPAQPNIALNAYLEDQRRTVPGGPGTRALLCRPLHHLAGPVQGRGCLDAGGTLVILRRFDAEAVLALVHRHRLTHLSMVPTMALRIANLPDEIRRRHDVSSIRSLHVGGAPVPYELKKRLVEMFGPNCIYEGYGSTELRYVTVMTPSDQMRKPGSCGRPYAGVELRIVDTDGRALPPGESGEILVRTPLLFSGYLNRPREDWGVDADGYFHTGDAGFLDSDGFLHINGRLKDMIIRGGVNIYPAEIEDQLLRHPAIQEAAVVGIPHADLGEVPKAFCELRIGATATEAELRTFLSACLAPYKVPAAFEFSNSLPRNAMGKVVKRHLTAPADNPTHSSLPPNQEQPQ